MSKTQTIFIPYQTENPILPREAYMSIRMIRAHLRGGLFKNNRYPIVHAVLNYAASENTNEITYITVPKLPDGVFADPKRVLVKNALLLPTTLYRGGEIKFYMQLISIPGVETTGPLLDLISEMTRILSVPVAIMISLAKSVHQSINDILRLRDATLILGAEDTLASGGHLQPGLFIVVHTDQNLNVGQWTVQDDLLYFDGQAIQDMDYFIIGIERITHMSNWHLMVDIGDAYRQLHSAVVQGLRGQELQATFLTFRDTVLGSINLTQNDKIRIVNQVFRGLKEAFSSTQDMSMASFRGDPVADRFHSQVTELPNEEILELTRTLSETDLKNLRLDS